MLITNFSLPLLRLLTLSVLLTFCSSVTTAQAQTLNVVNSGPEADGNVTPTVIGSKAQVALGLMDTAAVLAPPPIRMNKRAQKFVADYLSRNEADLEKIHKRSKPYFTKIDAVFRQHSLPVQLKYLAVIESELNTAAVSRVGAAGLWQFMPQTARYLGLKVSARTDERKQLKKSTIAAAQYVKTLYHQFDDWLLVIAAYNSGAGPVLSAIKKAGTRDFWLLQQYLPAETRAHVKRYIGAHYYFESEGSLTTLTKAETAAYLAALCEHKESLNVIREIRSGTSSDTVQTGSGDGATAAK